MPANAKPKDKFWKLYVSIVAGGVLLVSGIAVILFTSKSANSENHGNILGSYEETIQSYPFEETPIIYQDVLARGWENWSWDSSVNFQYFLSPERGNSIRVDLQKPNSGFLITAPHLSTGPYNSLKMSLYFEATTSDVFVEFSDANEKVIGTQLLSWYADGKYFKANTWYDIFIPLENMNAVNKKISGISVSSATTKVFYLDNISFSKDYIFFPPWAENKNSTIEEYYPPINLFDASGASTPYTSDFYSDKNSWKAIAGKSTIEFSKMRLETSTSSNYGSFALKGSSLWTNYRYNIFLDWAMGDSINLLARYTPDNFFSCSFFDDGANVTLYQFQNGKQIELDSAPNFTRKRVYSWTKTKSLGVEVNGVNVYCLVDGEVKLKHKAKIPMPLVGGLNIEIWSPENVQSTMVVNKVTAEVVK